MTDTKNCRRLRYKLFKCNWRATDEAKDKDKRDSEAIAYTYVVSLDLFNNNAAIIARPQVITAMLCT